MKRTELFNAIAQGGLMQERDCFFNDMDTWRLLDDVFRLPLQKKWRELMALSKNPKSQQMVQVVLDLNNMAHGISNAASHMVGYIAKEVSDFVGRQDPSIPTECRLDQLEDSIRKFILKAYQELLEACGCDACLSVLRFDRR